MTQGCLGIGDVYGGACGFLDDVEACAVMVTHGCTCTCLHLYLVVTFLAVVTFIPNKTNKHRYFS